MKFSTLSPACLAIVAAVAVWAQIGVKPTKDFTVTDAHDAKFSVGDVWEYRTRTGEEHSHVTIIHLDVSPDLGVIVHVAVNGIRLANCNHGPEPDNVMDMPFARKAFDSSVTKKVDSGQILPSGWQDAYGDWKNAYSAGKAGIYVISIADAVGVAEKTFQQGNGCDITNTTVARRSLAINPHSASSRIGCTASGVTCDNACSQELSGVMSLAGKPSITAVRA